VLRYRQPLGDVTSRQARSALEGSAVVLACAHATPAGLAKLHDLVERMQCQIAQKRSPLEYTITERGPD
jgi:DNA-binding GntR family transcriptional regulator